jgi:O-antigen ligase
VARWAGSAVAVDGPRRSLVLRVAILAVVVPVASAVLPERVRRAFVSIELPLLFLLLATVVLRIRGADDLAYNPLDPAAQFRVLCISLALVLGALSLTSPRVVDAARLSAPVRMYAVYIIVVFAGASLSVNPTLTAYRGIELIATFVVVCGAVRVRGWEAIERIGNLLYWFCAVMIISVWIGVIISPEQAIQNFLNTKVPIDWQIAGVFPSISSNGVGAFGVVLAIWSFVRVQLSSPVGKLRPMVGYPLALLGVASLLAAQYRTGYLALVIALFALLFLRKNWFMMGVLVVAVTAVVLLNPATVTEAEPYLLRGQTTDQAGELSGRVNWWKASIPVWEESPIIGRGLLTASRFEVLVQALGNKTTSGIHSTWVEALVGTGLLGLAILAICYLRSLRQAMLGARSDEWRQLAFLLLLIIGIRSFTGPTFESFGFFCPLFLWLAMLAYHSQAHSSAGAAQPSTSVG